jgi:hypothetical protein
VHGAEQVRAHVVSPTLIQCYSPSTILPDSHPKGYAGTREVKIALNGGADATPDDVDYVGRTPDPVGFIYYHVKLAACARAHPVRTPRCRCNGTHVQP